MRSSCWSSVRITRAAPASPSTALCFCCAALPLVDPGRGERRGSNFSRRPRTVAPTITGRACVRRGALERIIILNAGPLTHWLIVAQRARVGVVLARSTSGRARAFVVAVSRVDEAAVDEVLEASLQTSHDVAALPCLPPGLRGARRALARADLRAVFDHFEAFWRLSIRIDCTDSSVWKSNCRGASPPLCRGSMASTPTTRRQHDGVAVWSLTDRFSQPGRVVAGRTREELSGAPAHWLISTQARRMGPRGASRRQDVDRDWRRANGDEIGGIGCGADLFVVASATAQASRRLGRIGPDRPPRRRDEEEEALVLPSQEEGCDGRLGFWS